MLHPLHVAQHAAKVSHNKANTTVTADDEVTCRKLDTGQVRSVVCHQYRSCYPPCELGVCRCTKHEVCTGAGFFTILARMSKNGERDRVRWSGRDVSVPLWVIPVEVSTAVRIVVIDLVDDMCSLVGWQNGLRRVGKRDDLLLCLARDDNELPACADIDIVFVKRD